MWFVLLANKIHRLRILHFVIWKIEINKIVMSEEANCTKTEVENGVPETSTAEEKEHNEVEQNDTEPGEEAAKGSSKFSAFLS